GRDRHGPPAGQAVPAAAHRPDRRFVPRRGTPGRLPRTERRGQLRPPLRSSEPAGCALWHIPVDSSHKTSYVLCVVRCPPLLGPLQTSREEGAWTLRDSAASTGP